MLTELLEVLNSETTNGAWSDARLLAYLSEGQDKFCEETGFFVDIANYSLTLVTNTALYAIPARAIQVMNIWYGNKVLGKVQQDVILTPDNWPIDLGTTETGMPVQWQTDQTTGFIKLAPTPTVSENGLVLDLHVWRYSRSPLNRMSSTITLTGTLHAGDVIAATVSDVVYSYVVLGTEGTLTAVATALAAVIDASTAFVATASGQVISISALALETSTSTTVVVSGAGATVTATAADVYSASPEIPSQQRACIEWAAYKALNHHDMEAQEPVKAQDHKDAFEDYVTDGINAFRRLHNLETRVGTAPAYRT